MKTQEMKEKELKPCPFCGGAASTPRNIAGPRSEPRWYIYCKSEHHACLTVRTDASTEQAAIAAWNRRPASDSALYRALNDCIRKLETLNGGGSYAPEVIPRTLETARAALASATPQGVNK